MARRGSYDGVTAMYRKLLFAYAGIAVALIVTSAVTTARAKRVSGDDHYLFTQTSIFVNEPVPPANETDAALDAAFAEDDDEEAAADAGTLLIARPMFVLGFLDVTGPFTVLGGAALAAGALVRRRRRARTAPAEVSQS